MRRYFPLLLASLILLLTYQAIQAQMIPAEYDETLQLLRREGTKKEIQKTDWTLAVEKLNIALSKAKTADAKDEINLLLSHCYFFMEDYDKAIESAKRIMQHNPNKKKDYPEQKIWHASPRGILGWCYYAKGEHQKAIDYLTEQLEHNRQASAIIALVAQSRRKLSKSGVTLSSPIVFAKGSYVGKDCPIEKGYLLVSSSEFAEAMGLTILSQKEDENITLSKGDRKLILRPGSLASIGASSISLPVAPIKDQTKTFIPLRFVAEYFGAKVKWDPVSKIAWVS